MGFEWLDGRSNGMGMMSTIERHGVNPRYSKAVVHGDTVYLAGQVAVDPVPASAADQTRKVLEQIDHYLAECGTDKSKLLSAIVLFSDWRHFDEINSVWDAWVVPGQTPARTPIETRLLTPPHRVAIQVIAAR